MTHDSSDPRAVPDPGDRARSSAHPSGPAGSQGQGASAALTRFVEGLRAFGAGLDEFYRAPYRRTFARAVREEDDEFLLVVLGEALGVPDPAAYWSVELLPFVYEDFHAWHTRMGMDRSPLSHMGCC
ncbi:cory-CC-star protein [Brevibacterium litoralis]|uniref:cory-CC-star protein n=1 Tax=Brevibacterium litoralis TaxID=3138935 RepID=UPI003D9A1080